MSLKNCANGCQWGRFSLAQIKNNFFILGQTFNLGTVQIWKWDILFILGHTDCQRRWGLYE